MKNAGERAAQVLSIGVSPFLASNSVHLYAHPLTLARLDRACSATPA